MTASWKSELDACMSEVSGKRRDEDELCAHEVLDPLHLCLPIRRAFDCDWGWYGQGFWRNRSGRVR
jgi:hypothetical protein